LPARPRNATLALYPKEYSALIMSSHAPQLLSSVFHSGAPRGPQKLTRELILMKEQDAAEPPQTKRRVMIWDLHHSTHCSIIGTCLSTAELKRLLLKLEVSGAETADDHDLHMLGVMLAGRPEAGAKVLQKALDRRHDAAIRQFTRAKDAVQLTALWEEALGRGDIPGAYWATLTHPAATDTVFKRAFGDVHMLSHLVGAANRADIRRLKALEDENTALRAKLERQQRQLRDGFVERDATIRRLNALLAHNIARAEPAAGDGDELAVAAAGAIADLDRRLKRETDRRERLEKRGAELTHMLRVSEHRRESAERQSAIMAKELGAIEERMRGLLTPAEGVLEHLDLSRLVVLYVGGRAHQVPQLKALVERAGAGFLHHDGGIEHSVALLPGLISRANWTLFPVDCVSHAAMATIKRVCQQAGKPFQPLRTSGLTCLLAALLDLQRATRLASHPLA
jgi:Uncharacterized protein conserved in bacteria (DUF2325)